MTIAFRTLLVAALAHLVSGPAAAQYARPAGKTLRELAEARGIHFGANFPHLVAGKGTNHWERSPIIADEKAIAADHFTMMTAGWEIFPGHSWRGAGQNDFAGSDAYLQWCRARDIAFHGHGLGYAHRVDWFKRLPAGTADQRAELRRIYETYVQDTVAHFRGRIALWDVCNEHLAVPYSAAGFLGQHNYWKAYREEGAAGPDDPLPWFARTFELAHAADPQARLIYLDFNNEVVCPKSDFMYRLVQDLRARGAPLHGVGFQMHLDTTLRVSRGQPHAGDAAYFESMAANFRRFGELGLELWITELEVSIDPAKDRPGEIQRQAEIYGRIVETALAAPGLRGIKLWGILDRDTWNHVLPARPYLFDEQAQPKPAFFAVQAALER